MVWDQYSKKSKISSWLKNIYARAEPQVYKMVSTGQGPDWAWEVKWREQVVDQGTKLWDVGLWVANIVAHRAVLASWKESTWPWEHSHFDIL